MPHSETVPIQILTRLVMFSLAGAGSVVPRASAAISLLPKWADPYKGDMITPLSCFITLTSG